MSGLPRPVDSDQEYLAAILAELRAIRALLEPDSPQPSAQVELREPQKRRKRVTEAG